MYSSDIVLSAALAVCFWCIVRWTTGPGFRFSPAILFFVVFALQQVFGCMSLVDPSDPRRSLARTGLLLGMLGFTAGVGAVNVWLGFRPAELSTVRDRFEFHERDLGAKLIVMIIGYLVSLAILAAYFQSSGGIPLFDGIAALASGDELRLAQQLLKDRRMEVTYFESSSYRGQGYVDQVRMVALPYIVPCFVLWARGQKKRRWHVLAGVAACPAILFLMATGQRHPVIAFLLASAILAYIVSSPATHKKILGIFFAVGFVIFFAMTFMLGRYTHTDKLGSDLLMVFLGIWNRIIYSNAYGTIALFDLFPNPEPFRWGMTWLRDLQGFLPGPYVAFSSWLYRRLYGTVGTAAPMCFGEMYVNFGLWGIVAGSACMGVVLQLTQVYWARRRSLKVEDLVLYALLSMACMRWAMGGLLAPIQHGAVGLPLLAFAVRAGQLFVVGLRTAAQRANGLASRLPKRRTRPGNVLITAPEA